MLCVYWMKPWERRKCVSKLNIPHSKLPSLYIPMCLYQDEVSSTGTIKSKTPLAALNQYIRFLTGSITLSSTTCRPMERFMLLWLTSLVVVVDVDMMLILVIYRLTDYYFPLTPYLKATVINDGYVKERSTLSRATCNIRGGKGYAKHLYLEICELYNSFFYL